MRKQWREAYIVPTKAWPGDGLLGCELSMGAKYAIPLPKGLKRAKTDPKSATPKLASIMKGSKSKSKSSKINYKDLNFEMSMKTSMLHCKRFLSFVIWLISKNLI